MGRKGKKEKAWKRERRSALGGDQSLGRSCGECTACCHVMEIPWLDKPAYRSCEHLREGSGCSIYATRPKGCRDFNCMWLAETKRTRVLTEDDRPDKLGVMLTAAPVAGYNGVDLWEIRPGALESERVRKIKAALRARKCILIEARAAPEGEGFRRKLLTPTIEGRPVMIKDVSWSDRENPNLLF